MEWLRTGLGQKQDIFFFLNDNIRYLGTKLNNMFSLKRLNMGVKDVWVWRLRWMHKLAMSFMFFNRPGVAGAVLQAAL